MESTLLGLVLDSSVLVAAERANLTTPEVIKNIRASAGELPITICALTIAELAHGIYRANLPNEAGDVASLSGTAEAEAQVRYPKLPPAVHLLPMEVSVQHRRLLSVPLIRARIQRPK